MEDRKELTTTTAHGPPPAKSQRFDRCLSLPFAEIKIEPTSIKSLKHLDSTKFKLEIKKWAKSVAKYARQYAMVTDKGSSYYGAQVWLNVWNPKVEYGELSASKMWLVGAKSQDFNEEYNSIEAGWIVYPSRYKDSKTRFYISWTGEGANNTGCYDLDCQGFVQTNRKYAIGASITPVSSYNGSQFELPVTIFKDTRTGDWWLQLSGTNMGYWPNSLFTVLSDHANIVNWGGEILNDRSEGHHTTTQMGSGHFPTEGYKKSAFMTVLRVTDSNYAQRNPGFLKYTLTSLGCYDVKIVDRDSGGHAVSFGACQSIYNVSATTEKVSDLKHKGYVKTIETNDGEIIDCVDIYKQPAFDNPLIKDIQMSPSSYPLGMETDSKSNQMLLQDWQKYGECPEGTIPIRRSTSSSHHTESPPFAMIQRQSNFSIKSSPSDGHEYALVSDEGSNYYGASATLNVWNPSVEYGEFSSGLIWVISSTAKEFYENFNSVQAGWTVYPSRYKDIRARVFIYWTGDGYQKTGCFDLDCKGFVQISRHLVLGAALEPLSSYGGRQYEIPITIFKDSKTGDWWLKIAGNFIGYWPKSLFTGLVDHATLVNWGGEIVNDRSGGHHTTTQMGSGHFPSEGFTKAAYMDRLKVFDSDIVAKDPGFIVSTLTSLGCYNITIERKVDGQSISYGGPGFNPACF
ncbi:uncharacterized protein LOC124946196 [Impatiens glandulifera]|uniref:uncharacterized protein LOC124946196 n=1 Tax=Impatiens glandulifera TaxID=253017 RepID=UPI001FB0D968|nr:uncharacterized protein LOC124946196 [Impatiens glandulifera]